MTGLIYADSASRDYYSVDELKGIKADLVSENLIIKPAVNDEVKVDIKCKNEIMNPEIKIERDVLYIRSLRRAKNNEKCSIYIYLPENLTSSFIDVDVRSGDIEVSGVIAQKILLNTSSGDIICKNVKSSGNLEVSVTSGDIDLDSISAKEAVLNISSGDIDAKAIHGNKYKIKAASGDVKIKEADIDILECNTLSGTQRIEELDCDSFELSSASGSVKLGLVAEPWEDSSIKTISGSVDLRIPQDSRFQLEVNSRSGSFKDEFLCQSLKPKSSVVSKYNGGGVNISIATVSGSISLDD